MNKRLSSVLLLCLILFAGCSRQQVSTIFLNRDEPETDTTARAEALIKSDPAGAVPAPELPPDFAAAARIYSAPPVPGSLKAEEGGIAYSVKLSAPNAPELIAAFERNSLLSRLADSPPQGLIGLEQRLNASLGTGRDILNAYGYHSGSVRGRIEVAGHVASSTAAPTVVSGSPGVPYAQGHSGGPGEQGEPGGPGEPDELSEPDESGEPDKPGGLGKSGEFGEAGGPGESGGARHGPGAQEARQHGKAVVYVTFTPGPQYRMGRSVVTWPALAAAAAEGSGGQPGRRSLTGRNGEHSVNPASEPADSAAGHAAGSAADRGAALPASLADVGLPSGAPAVAGQVLDAVDRVREAFRNQGYPFAAIAGARYIVDHKTHSLEAEIHVEPGVFARMGDIDPQGVLTVRPSYLEALRTWKPGDAWDQSQVDSFRESLRQSGLFQSIDVAPAQQDDAAGLRPIVTNLVGASERTVGGAVKYDSDFGFGVQGLWEHRNFTGQGDRLRLELPLWADIQGLTGGYRLPFFMRRDQAFIARAALLNEDTDAYDMTAGALAAGVERRFSERWTGSVQGSVEGGSIKDPDKPRHDYLMLGVPLGLAYSNAGSLLDASRGWRVQFALAPYVGDYRESFSILRSRIDTQWFIPLAGEDKLVLALRGAYGSVIGANAEEIPPSARFYSGGGGSVRGYAFQSLGPRTSNKAPLGGASLVELGVEPRWKITEQWGLVAFLDGGMAYADSTPELGDLGGDLHWGAGIGLRYFTAIGPLRFDVATPLNPRDDDDIIQFYISIGQSF